VYWAYAIPCGWHGYLHYSWLSLCHLAVDEVWENQ
jgi:hypothetical protein